jgi:hypothetical protein
MKLCSSSRSLLVLTDLPAQTGSPKAQTQAGSKDDEATYDHEREALRKLQQALPGRSRITLGKGHLLPGYSDHMSPDKCSTSRLAQHQVRRLFRTYHVVSGVEHEGYSESGCAIDGDILIDGRRYTLAPNQ